MVQVVPDELARDAVIVPVRAGRPMAGPTTEEARAMITCPWCEEDATILLADVEPGDGYRCPTCGTCVDLVEEPTALDAAA
jgi:hypothetical protein